MKSNPLELWSKKKLQVIDSVKSGKTNLVRVFRNKPLSILDHEFIEYCESSCPEVILAPKNEELYGVISVTFNSKDMARNELLKFLRDYKLNYHSAPKVELNKIMNSNPEYQVFRSRLEFMIKVLKEVVQDPEFGNLELDIFILVLNRVIEVYFRNDKIPTVFSIEECKCITSSLLDYFGYSINWELVDEPTIEKFTNNFNSIFKTINF